MKTRHIASDDRARPRLLRAPLLITLLSPTLVLAQTSPSGPEGQVADEDTVVLSPFQVDSTRDTGYATASTLSGTRIRTNLEDVATTIQVVNKQFLEDTGSTSAKDLLVYTTSTEVTGPGGNFSDARSSGGPQPLVNFESGLTANPGSRVRGLLAAANTRDFFGTGVPFDSYNLDRIEINRGANATLFGIGSPAGIINSTTIRPRFRNGGAFEAAVDNFGSFRTSLDWEHQIVESQVSVRLAAMNDAEKFEQEFAFEDDQRIYGSVVIRPEFLRRGGFLSDANFRLTGETGRIDSNRPRINPPYETFNRWIAQGSNTVDPRFTNLRAVNRDVINIDILRTPNVFFADPNSSTPGRSGNGSILGTVGVANRTTGFPGGNGFVPAFGGNPPVFGGGTPVTHIFAFYGSPAPFSTNVAGRNPFSNGTQILDEAIYPYRDHLLDGPNKEEHFDFDSFGASAEFLFLENTAGIELAYFGEKRGESRLSNITNSAISGVFSVDINSHQLNGEPNPNFGRPYMVAEGLTSFSRNDSENARVTAFYQLDLQKRLGAGWLGKLLGNHTFTGNYSTSTDEGYGLTGRDYIVGSELGAIPGNRTRSDTVDDVVRRFYYSGPSLIGVTDPATIRLSPVTAVQDPSLVTPADGGFVVWDNGLKQWVTPFLTVIKNLTDDGVPFAAAATRSRTEIDSSVFVWQGNLLADTLVGTLSWRKDSFTSFGNAPVVRGSRNEVLTDSANFRLSDAPTLDTSDNTFAYGIVAKVPRSWLERVPGVSRLSVFYNDSENFQPTGIRQNAFGESVGPPTGTTEDYGFALGLLEDRFYLRTTWYETAQANNGIGAEVNNITNRVVNLWSDSLTRINRNGGTIPANLLSQSPGISQAEVDRQVAFILANPFPLQDLYQFRIDPNDGFVSFTAPQGLTDTSDLVSKGVELELTWNPTETWRITANVAKQESIRSNSARVATRLVELVTPLVSQFRDLPTVDSFVNNVGGTFDGQVLSPLERLQSLDGLSSQEVREWRFNVITNYAFAGGGPLRGWNVGGALRWQDKPVIGNFTFFDTSVSLWRTDPTRPILGESDTRVDVWLGYSRKIAKDRVVWRTQLNIRNLLADDDLIPIRGNPETGAYETFTIPEPITFTLSTKLIF